MSNHSKKKPATGFKSRYTAEEKAKFFTLLKEKKGNIAAACASAGVSTYAGRYWVAKATDKEIIDPEIREQVQRHKGGIETRLENLLYKIFDSANGKISKAPLKDQMEAADKILKMLNSIKRPPREIPPATPEQETTETAALKLLDTARQRLQTQAVQTQYETEEPERVQ